VQTTKDIALIIMFAVLSFIFQTLIGQIPNLITGIPGIGYVFTIIYSIIQSVTWLMYEGRRWRIFAQGLLMTLLVFSFIPEWTPPVAMATILNMLIVELVFNSLYGSFNKKRKIFWWIIIAQIYYWSTHSTWILLFSSLYYPIGAVLANWFVPIMSIMLPIMIIESVIGASLGYKIYQRVKTIQS
jgi:hypothetical protein